MVIKWQCSIVMHRNNESLTQSIEQMRQTLKNMLSDKYNCHYCVKKYGSDRKIEKLLEANVNHIKQQTELIRLRVILCCFSSFNIFFVLIVYGGPITTNTISIINGVLLVANFFIEEFIAVILIESIVVLISIITICQVSHTIIIVIVDNCIRESNEKDN